MRHLRDDKERHERHLHGEGFDISWIADATKKNITDLCYTATAQEGQCSMDNCCYSTLSRRKMFDHIVTHYITIPLTATTLPADGIQLLSTYETATVAKALLHRWTQAAEGD